MDYDLARGTCGSPWVHTFQPESSPEAVVTKIGPFLYDVNIRDGLMTYREGWTCVGRRWAEWKARRVLARHCASPSPSYTITL